MGKTIRRAALALTLLFALGTAGCADTTWAIKVNGATIPSGVYISYLLGYSSQVLNGETASSSSSSSESNPLSVTASGASSSSAASDPWATKVDDETAVSWVMNNALKDTERFAVVEALAAQKKLVLTSDETSTVQQYAKTYASYAPYSKNGVSESSLERVIGFQFLQAKLFDSYYAKGGETPVSDTDLQNYYTSNFVRIKQIFFNKYDDTGTLLASDKLDQIKATASQVLQQVQSSKPSFDSLVSQYNQDTGMQQYPDGYIFDKNGYGDINAIQVFKDAAFSMNVGDVRLIESDEGYHIMYKLAVDPKASTFDSTMKEQVLEAMKEKDFTSLLDSQISKSKVVQNKHTLDKYNPKSLKYQ